MSAKFPILPAFLILIAFCARVRAGWIVPGATWLDTNRSPFNTHAGGLTVDHTIGRFYWFGEYKFEGQDEGGGISMYSSDDLATWESHGLALGQLRQCEIREIRWEMRISNRARGGT